MKSKIIFWIMMLIASNIAFGSIDTLIESYDYDFSNTTETITNFTDYMIDTNSNSINDTLIINFSSTGTDLYYLVKVYNDNSLIQNYSNKTFVTFSTKELSTNQSKYSIEVYDTNYAILFRKYNLTTNIYSTFEKGTTIQSISDSNINNNYIQITLNLNISQTSIENISIALNYNDSSIETKNEIDLIQGLQTIYINFTNETIKSTHHNGIYQINNIKIGEKIISTNHTTSSYNYETFAKTSYIKEVISGTNDIDQNNLSNEFYYNVTISSKENKQYTLSGTIYDYDNNFITYLEKNITLPTGIQIVKLNISGKELYKTYYSGEINLNNLNLKDYDIIYEAHTTDIYYSDFEKPPLPDLIIQTSSIPSENYDQINVTVNITNIGLRPAFNIMMDVFDNYYLDSSAYLSYLESNQSYIFNYTINDPGFDPIITAITDLSNQVDESNESNNIYQNIELTKHRMVVKNSTGHSVAYIEDTGDIYLKGTCSVNSTCNPPSDSFILKNSTDHVVSYIDPDGNLCLVNGNCIDEDSTCNPARDAFIIQNETSNVSYIDFDGNLCLTGILYEGW